jgi:hypothetical protein
MRHSNKQLASLISIATLVLAAREAHAATTLSPGQSYNVGTMAEVLTKGTKYGAMGAEFDAHDDVSSVASTGELKQSIGAGASVWLFGNQYPLCSFGVTGSSAGGGSMTVDTSLLGHSVSSEPHGTLVLSVGKCTTEKAPEEQLMIGPVPVVMELGAGVCPSFNLSGSVSSTGGTTSFTFTATPDFSVGATAYIGIGTEVASAGVKGSLNLLDVQTPINNTMTVSGGAVTDSTYGNVDISFLNGEFDLYAKAGWGWFSVEYDYQLLSWPGFHWSFAGWSDEKPVAKSLALAITTTFDGVARATFTYAGGLAQSDSPFAFYRASDATGTNSTRVNGGTTTISTIDYLLKPADSGSYLKFCITPKSTSQTGTEACSAWVGVGPLLTLSTDENHLGRSHILGYKHNGSGACVNLTGLDFNDALSSYHWQYDSSMTKADLAFYEDINCVGAKVVEEVSGNASDGSLDRNSVSAKWGSSWNDRISSFRVIWNDDTTAKDVAVSLSGPDAVAAYTYFDVNGLPESGSQYQWQRADDSTGTNAAVIQGYGTTNVYHVQDADEGKFLRVCVKAGNGVTLGEEACADWVYAGKFMVLYKGANYSDYVLHLAYEHWTSGTCVNLAGWGQDNMMSSFTVNSSPFVIPAGDTTTYGVTFYDGADCSGATYPAGFSTAGGSTAVSYVSDGFNDRASSFRINFRRVEAIDPEVVFSGDTALPSYTYFNSTGRAEAATKFRWQRADDGAGTNTTVVRTYGTTPGYAITPSDGIKYLRVCIKASDGVMTGPEICSSWGTVGFLVTLYDQTGFGGNAYSFPYQYMNGACLKLPDYGVSNVQSAIWGSAHYNQPAGDTTMYGTTLYASDDCSAGAPEDQDLLKMEPGTTGTENDGGIAVGSGTIWRSMRINYPHFDMSAW